MGNDRERNIYRVVVLGIVIVGALVFMWMLTQGDLELGDSGIFQFLPEPTGEPTETPTGPRPE